MDDAGENPVPGGAADAAGPSYDFFDRPVDEAGCTDVLVQKDEDLTPTAPDMGSAPLPALDAALPAGLRLVDALSVGAGSGPAHAVDPMEGFECDEALKSGEELAAAFPLPPEFAYLKDQIDACRRYLQKKRPVLEKGPDAKLHLGPPPDGKSHTLVLDMDETMLTTYWSYEDGTPLIFSGNVRHVWEPNASVCVSDIKPGKPVKVEIWYRPGLFKFLSTVSERYEIVIFSAGNPSYVEAVIREAVDPENKYISHVFAHDKLFYYDTQKTRRCGLWEMDGVATVKNIDQFFEGDHPRRKEKVVCVDDNPSYFVNHLGNVVPIRPFDGNANDNELEALGGFLMSITDANDVRDEIKLRYDLPAYVGSQSRYHTSSDAEASPAASCSSDVDRLISDLI